MISPIKGSAGCRHVPYIFATIAFGTLAACILVLNNGTFVYSLDDAYIHLTLSENLARLHYGLNPNEFSSPSSSIVWSVLLAPFAWCSFHVYLPLIINIALTFGTIGILARIVRNDVLHKRGDLDCTGAFLVCVLTAALNLVGVAFTGMEHTLQVFLALAAVLGMCEFLKNGQVSAWFLPVLLVNPLVRFENLSISLAALLILAFHKRYRVVFLCAAVLVAELVAFSLFLKSLGLPFLPSSVLSKFEFRERAAEFATTVFSLPVSFVIASPQALVLSLAGILLLILALRNLRRDRRNAELAIFAAIPVFGHVCLGSYGWFYRYEVYVYSLLMTVLLILIRTQLMKFVAGTRAILSACLLTVAIVVFCYPLPKGTLLTPLASNNIYEQQFQMGHFARDIHAGPVAVNDIGCVSYRNPNYVLDLMGLGSEECRRRRMEGDLTYVQELTERHGIPLLMVYESWMKLFIPEHWVKTAVLKRKRHNHASAENSVAFYDTKLGDSAALRDTLVLFSSNLPSGTHLEILGDQAWTE